MAIAGAATTAGQQQPTFRAGADVIAVEVQVVDSKGAPIPALGPERFEVSVGGRRRRVLSAELIRYDPPAPTGAPTAPGATPPAPAPSSPAATGARGRTFMVAIDEASFRPSEMPGMAAAVRAFLAKLQKTDLVGLFAFPVGPEYQPTLDHDAVGRALDGVMGQRHELAGNRFLLMPSEIVDLELHGGRIQAPGPAGFFLARVPARRGDLP